jgi:hypothetical protein
MVERDPWNNDCNPVVYEKGMDKSTWKFERNEAMAATVVIK